MKKLERLKEILGDLHIKYQCKIGKAVDIRIDSKFPGNVLSNMYPNSFEMDGVHYGSMEGFLQSLKYLCEEDRLKVGKLSGKAAKFRSVDSWIARRNLYIGNQWFNRDSINYQWLIYKAYYSMFMQNMNFRIALADTKRKIIYYTTGETDSRSAILTVDEFMSVLLWLRSQLDGVAKDNPFSFKCQIDKALARIIERAEKEMHDDYFEEIVENLHNPEQNTYCKDFCLQLSTFYRNQFRGIVMFKLGAVHPDSGKIYYATLSRGPKEEILKNISLDNLNRIESILRKTSQELLISDKTN
ncbi:MAG: hypothetical protein PHD11_07055 [Bacteroidales bacterium]|nr:hypothetical protein [Bacteroidales bacterium]MDD4670620.1 hypothetical protein [Bacteroidales bacterium]